MESNYEFTGTVHIVTAPEKKSENLEIADLILKRSEGMFTNMVRFQVANDYIALLRKVKKGDRVTLTFNIIGKEKEGKFFVNLNVIDIVDAR